MDEIKTIRGMKDITYPESARWDEIIKICETLLEGYGYRKIYLPVVEYTGLFSRSIGEGTDIVSKEMYTFADRKGRMLSLRPEGTAGAVRAAIENKMLAGNIREKIFYFGPMFRYERPQEGRYRQFFQFGCEVFGSPSPAMDAEITALAAGVMEKCGISNYRLLINSVGCSDCRKDYIKAIKEKLSGKEENLCDDCKKRMESNTLRILDCKSPDCGEIYKELPEFNDFLCDKCRGYIGEYKKILELKNIPYVQDPRLVRGLDYYTGPVFEIEYEGLAIIAGGRYDGLVKQLGGPDVPACGWALGLERLSEIAKVEYRKIPAVYVALLEGGSIEYCADIAGRLRAINLSVEEDYENNALGKKIKMADKKGVNWIIIVGPEESAGREICLKNLKTGNQENISSDEIEKVLMERTVKGG